MNEGIEGVSKKKFIMSVDNSDDPSISEIEDKYTKQIPASQDESDDKRDAITKHRESFLNIYKENIADVGESKEDKDPSDGIRFKRDSEEENSGFELKTATESQKKGKPLI